MIVSLYFNLDCNKCYENVEYVASQGERADGWLAVQIQERNNWLKLKSKNYLTNAKIPEVSNAKIQELTNAKIQELNNWLTLKPENSVTNTKIQEFNNWLTLKSKNSVTD